MELTYRLTRHDYRQFEKLARARMASRKKGLWRWNGPAGAALLLALASLVVTISVLEWLTRSGIIDSRANLAAGLAYMWGIGTMMLCILILRRWYGAVDGSTPDELLLKADGDGLQITDQVRTDAYSWRAFTDISEDGDYIVLWLAPGKGIIVPLRAMADEDMRRAFVDLVRTQIAPAAPPLAPA
jgi:hypothetical protein